MPEIAIIDADIGNLRSVQKAFERAGATAPVTDRADELVAADALVLPGVGAFADAMRKLHSLGLVELIRGEVMERGKPLLGICLGMQLLAQSSTEGGAIEGLGLIPATVERLEVAGYTDWSKKKLTLPHIGWNSIYPKSDSRLFAGIDSGADFYFVHSYALSASSDDIVAATCGYGREFVAAIEAGKILATQFHPEKSHKDGAAVIENYLKICAETQVAA